MENFTWILEGSFTLSALRYLVEKWDDKSAAWIKVKMFSLYTDACRTRERNMRGKFPRSAHWKILQAAVAFYLNFPTRTLTFGAIRAARARFIYRFIALTLFIRVREFFARWSPLPRPGIPFDLFIFIFHPLRREIVPITRKKRRSNEAADKFPRNSANYEIRARVRK